MQLIQAIAEFINGHFSTHDRSKKTRYAYRLDLEQFVAFAGKECALDQLSGVLIEQWAADMRSKGYSPASMRRKIVVLKVFCSYWLRRGVLSESPFWRVKLSLGRMEQLPRSLSEREIKTLLVQAGRVDESGEIQRKGPALAKRREPSSSFGDYRSLRNLALVDLLFATGMRVGEASALDIDDFSVMESVFRIKGKGGRHRLAYIVDKETIRIQRSHLELRALFESESKALFINAARERLSTQGIANVITAFRQEAGLERNITPHMLRHTVATLLLRSGVDIRVVQEFLGHASIATTQRYTHIAKDHLIGVLRKHHPSLRLRA
jgi:site-specific recombinase XerD